MERKEEGEEEREEWAIEDSDSRAKMSHVKKRVSIKRDGIECMHVTFFFFLLLIPVRRYFDLLLFQQRGKNG